jgi:hypothetical protein
MTDSDNNTFVRITNKDIYDEIKALKSMIYKYEADNSEAHDSIRAQAGLHQWMIIGATGIACAGITWLASHLLGG